jgi:peptidoglycan/LPS O-acetylase OafA/YrhL
MSERDHIPELDGLRGIAALMVVFHHMAQQFPGFSGATIPQRLLQVWLRFTTPGWMGVDVFFVLSGFLITGILLDTKRQPHFYRNFYMKRILRIFPLYYLMLVVLLIFFAKPWPFFTLCVFYLANFSSLFGISLIFGPLWSLSVEEHFYFLWPWAVKFVRMRALLAASLLTCFIEPAFRYYAFKHGFFDPYFSWFRFDGLALGAAIAITSRCDLGRHLKSIACVLWFAAVFVFCVSLPFGGYTRMKPAGTAVLYTCVSLFTGGVVCFVRASPNGRLFAVLRGKFLRFTGDISYCLYLIHLFVILGFYRVANARFFEGLTQALQRTPVLMYAVHSITVLGICYGIGALSKKYFEGPIRSYRIRFQ